MVGFVSVVVLWPQVTPDVFAARAGLIYNIPGKTGIRGQPESIDAGTVRPITTVEPVYCMLTYACILVWHSNEASRTQSAQASVIAYRMHAL